MQQSRLAQMAANQGGDDPQKQQEAEEARQQEEEARRDLITQILLPEARERLARIQLVRPQRAQQISAMIIRMAQSGQIRGRVSEEQLISVLDQVEAMEKVQSGKGTAESKITFQRKGDFSDDDDYLTPRASTTASAKKQADSDDDFDL